MIRPKIETEDLLLSITENCQTLIEQTHTRSEETLEYKLTKSRETFSFKPLLSVEGSWMIGLTSLEVYNSFFKIPEETNRFRVCHFPQSINGWIAFAKARDDIGRDCEISDITANDLKDEIIGPMYIEEYRKE